MISYRLDEFHITPEKNGAHVFSKVSFPIRYGRYSEIETTANFVMGDHLPSSNETSLLTLMRDGPDRYYSKGAIYLSPITDRSNRKGILKRFMALKNSSRLPTLAYLIQKL